MEPSQKSEVWVALMMKQFILLQCFTIQPDSIMSRLVRRFCMGHPSMDCSLSYSTEIKEMDIFSMFQLLVLAAVLEI